MVQVISLFSGAGFLDFGFTENDFDIIWGSEVEPEFAKANNINMRLRYGHREDRVKTIDISQVHPSELPVTRGIIGGPPCQDFSIGNANSPGVQGERGILVWDFLKKVAYLKPDFFLFENVDGLYKTKKNRDEALYPMLEIFEDMTRLQRVEGINLDFEIEELGYTTYFKVLNSLEYGIPQDRSRVFIIGFKKEIIETLENHNMQGFIWPKPIYPEAKKIFQWPNAWEFGLKINEADYLKNINFPYELTVHSAIHDQNYLAQLPNHVSFKAYSQKFYQVLEGDTTKKSFKRLHRFKYSPTVAYGNNEVHMHPTLPRRLTVREALRLQSVPDWYHFPSGFTLTDMFKMVSNGVPYKLANKLSEQIKDVLTTYDAITHNQNLEGHVL